jgi:hypothetical protein
MAVFGTQEAICGASSSVSGGWGLALSEASCYSGQEGASGLPGGQNYHIAALRTPAAST